MNDVAELKQYVEVHARAQNIPRARYRAVLDQIRTDEGTQPGSWVGEWCAAAARLERDGKLLDACRHYNLARFPYVDGQARRDALAKCVRTFDRWRSDGTDIRPRHVDVPGGRVHCWTSGLSASDRRPLLIIMGGIVTIKEQWATALAKLRGLGMACLVAEMPGVGENPLGYDAESWRMLPAILDAVDQEADVAQTYVISLSFSGHMALRCATDDCRIKGVVIAGAPVSDFFTNVEWQANLPRITVDTLVHLTEAPDLSTGLRDWALTPDQLAALDIPVCCLSSKRDEIIPPGDLSKLKQHVRRLSVVEYDDVHGSPRHVAEARLWAALSVLRMRGVHNAQRAALSAIWRVTARR